MTYDLAFIMVGRCILWAILVFIPIVGFISLGHYTEKEMEIEAGIAYWIAFPCYVAVILCARYVQ